MPGQYHRNDQIQIVLIFIRLRPDIFLKSIPSKRKLSNILLLLKSALQNHLWMLFFDLTIYQKCVQNESTPTSHDYGFKIETHERLI